MLRLCLSAFIFTYLTQGWAEANTNFGLNVEQERERLLKRKKSFDHHQEARRKWHERRQARADDQRERRRIQAEQREQARRNFVRVEREISNEAYKEFVQQREQRWAELEKARQRFVKLQKKLRALYEDESYRIDGNKEFQL